MTRTTLSMLLAARNAEGEAIAKASHEIAPIPPSLFGYAIVVSVYVLSVFSAVLVGLRIYVRSYRAGRTFWQMGWDDYLAIAGFVPFIPSGVFAVIGVRYGLGAWDVQVPEGQLLLYQTRTKENMLYFELIYFGASLLTKLSMALMILRLTTEKKYSYIIWGSLGIMGVIGAGAFGVMFGNCQPFQATWNEKLGYCRWPESMGWIVISYVGAGGLALVDIVCAVTPFFILRDLQMPPRRKLSIQLILGLGILGCIAGMIRIPFFMYYQVDKYPNNTLYMFGHTVFWTIMEAGLGILACSLPPLRALFSKFYRGSSGQSGVAGNASSSGRPGGNSHHNSALGRSGNKTDQLRSKTSTWDRLDDDDASTEGIVRLTEIRVESSDGRLPPPRQAAQREF